MALVGGNAAKAQNKGMGFLKKLLLVMVLMAFGFGFIRAFAPEGSDVPEGRPGHDPSQQVEQSVEE